MDLFHVVYLLSFFYAESQILRNIAYENLECSYLRIYLNANNWRPEYEINSYLLLNAWSSGLKTKPRQAYESIPLFLYWHLHIPKLHSEPYRPNSVQVVLSSAVLS